MKKKVQDMNLTEVVAQLNKKSVKPWELVDRYRKLKEEQYTKK
jgi:hypothetical protein